MYTKCQQTMVPLIKTLHKRINSIQQQIQQLIWLDSLHTYDIYFFRFVVDPDSWDFIIKFVKFSFSLHNDIIATLLCLVVGGVGGGGRGGVSSMSSWKVVLQKTNMILLINGVDW